MKHADVASQVSEASLSSVSEPAIQTLSLLSNPRRSATRKLASWRIRCALIGQETRGQVGRLPVSPWMVMRLPAGRVLRTMPVDAIRMHFDCICQQNQADTAPFAARESSDQYHCQRLAESEKTLGGTDLSG